MLSGETLNVHWNLTLAANAMSVDLPYGKMDEVEALKGVKSVMLVPQYSIDPREQADLNTISSGNMIGSYNAWLEAIPVRAAASPLSIPAWIQTIRRSTALRSITACWLPRRRTANRSRITIC